MSANFKLTLNLKLARLKAVERGRQGTIMKHGTGHAAFTTFTPAPLPPAPPIAIDLTLQRALSKADQMLGRLDGLSSILRHPDLLIYFYIRKEAVLSSQIEGTQSTLSELLLFELEQSQWENDDVVEVSNYVAAMRHGLERIADGFPLSSRLLKEMHEALLSKGRGSDRTPGEFRTSQNWIGGTMPSTALYVPPPVQEMQTCLGAFETFMNGAVEDYPVLLQCAMLHLQFESIHPFLDGNGRLGRLLMTLLLVQRGVLHQPLLYVSLYLKQNKTRYYELLQSVRMDGDWEEWFLFFVEGVTQTAERAVALAKQILALFERDEARLQHLGVRLGTVSRVLHVLQRHPYATVRTVVDSTGIAVGTALAGFASLAELGIVTEISGRERGRMYRYAEYLRLLDEGTELA